MPAFQPWVGFSEVASSYCVPIMYVHSPGLASGEEREEESGQKLKIVWKMEHPVLSVGYSHGFM